MVVLPIFTFSLCFNSQYEHLFDNPDLWAPWVVKILFRFFDELKCIFVRTSCIATWAFPTFCWRACRAPSTARSRGKLISCNCFGSSGRHILRFDHDEFDLVFVASHLDAGRKRCAAPHSAVAVVSQRWALADRIRVGVRHLWNVDDQLATRNV